ncbi:nucleoside 2-deoxyribosyltransferase [Flavobacteriaceae bacterium]|nr:nucleoside 2-deoxyribosyltransferase [Flavobacteriaceae bacterium]MDC1402429.1 nucleoside 2-deoxyribosyltransferase [Flavobacteriaceae bacterium]
MTTSPKKFCFVLMPFDGDFDDIYKLGIKQSCIDAGAYCERVDEQIFNESILDRIYNQISKADIVIADMTNRNPNVFYEVGYAHALGKTTILLTKNSDDIPFDLKHYPHIIYNNKITQLKEELTTRVKWFVENETTEELSQKIDIDIYLGEESLSNKNVEHTVEKGKIPAPTFTLHNRTFRTYSPGDYSVGIITDENYKYSRRTEGSKTIKLPDNHLMHMYPLIEDILYPNSYTSFRVLLEPKVLEYDDSISRNPKVVYEEDQEITIRIFTPNGTRDYYLMIKYN